MHEQTMEQLRKTSQLAGGNVAYIEELFEAYLRDPNEVSEEWRNYFNQLPRVGENTSVDVPHTPIKEQFLLLSKNKHRAIPVATSTVSSDYDRKQVKEIGRASCRERV